MSRLFIVTWLWGTKYGPDDVRKLREGIRRNMKQEDYTFEVQAPAPEDASLLAGCFCRLRMFQREWQYSRGLKPGDRLVCMDLDSVVTGPLDQLFFRTETFMILQGANAANPCPFNGSLMMLRVGFHENVWNDFSLEAAGKVPFYEFPDDQGWLHHKLPNASGWKVGSPSGVYAFQKPGWPKGENLPSDACLVVFPGWRSPDKFKHLPWIKEHWL